MEIVITNTIAKLQVLGMFCMSPIEWIKKTEILNRSYINIENIFI